MKPQVSLCMIVRNEEANLPECLSCVDGLFEDRVVVDTGSTDATMSIRSSTAPHFALEPINPKLDIA